jgi:hypothetical protein
MAQYSAAADHGRETTGSPGIRIEKGILFGCVPLCNE